MRICKFQCRSVPTTLICACLGVAGCSSSPVQWSSVAPYAPNSQATAVGVNGDGASWFFQCDRQSVMSGLSAPGLTDSERTTRLVSIAFDNEPAESSSWRLEQRALVLRGEGARATRGTRIPRSRDYRPSSSSLRAVGITSGDVRAYADLSTVGNSIAVELPRYDFDREDVSGRDTIPVRLEKRRPRRALSPLRRGIDAVFAEYIRDRPATNMTP